MTSLKFKILSQAITNLFLFFWMFSNPFRIEFLYREVGTDTT
jgi:hypothetical protein